MSSEPSEATKKDQRVTPVGKFPTVNEFVKVRILNSKESKSKM